MASISCSALQPGRVPWQPYKPHVIHGVAAASARRARASAKSASPTPDRKMPVFTRLFTPDASPNLDAIGAAVGFVTRRNACPLGPTDIRAEITAVTDGVGFAPDVGVAMTTRQFLLTSDDPEPSGVYVGLTAKAETAWPIVADLDAVEGTAALTVGAQYNILSGVVAYAEAMVGIDTRSPGSVTPGASFGVIFTPDMIPSRQGSMWDSLPDLEGWMLPGLTFRGSTEVKVGTE